MTHRISVRMMHEHHSPERRMEWFLCGDEVAETHVGRRKNDQSSSAAAFCIYAIVHLTCKLIVSLARLYVYISDRSI